jgi:hypothetical protein
MSNNVQRTSTAYLPSLFTYFFELCNDSNVTGIKSFGINIDHVTYIIPHSSIMVYISLLISTFDLNLMIRIWRCVCVCVCVCTHNWQSHVLNLRYFTFQYKRSTDYKHLWTKLSILIQHFGTCIFWHCNKTLHYPCFLKTGYIFFVPGTPGVFLHAPK